MKRVLVRLALVLGLFVGVAVPPVGSLAAAQSKQDPQTITVYVTRTGEKYQVLAIGEVGHPPERAELYGKLLAQSEHRVYVSRHHDILRGEFLGRRGRSSFHPRIRHSTAGQRSHYTDVFERIH